MKAKDIYLVAKYSAHPRKKHSTNIPGYMKDPGNVKWNEEILITYGLKDKDFLSAKIVLNINKRKVERNSFQNGKTFDELFDYFYSENKEELNSRFRQFGINIVGAADESVQQDVQAQEEKGTGPEPAASAEPVVASEGASSDQRGTDEPITADPAAAS